MRSELILYALPTGELASACQRYFDAVEPSTANDFPPHCTLTGFFRRATDRVPEISSEVSGLGPVPPDEVEVVGLVTDAEWVGLELRSPWLQSRTESFARNHRLDPGDDALRPKDWLHLSLAYGLDDLQAHGALARAYFSPLPEGGWELALLERLPDRSWRRH